MHAKAPYVLTKGFEPLVAYLTNQMQPGDINVKDMNGITILHYAAHAGQFGTVQTLLSKGADANIKVEYTDREIL